MEGFSGRRLDPLGQGTRERITILARSHAMVVHDSVPADCIEKVVCLQGDKIVYQMIPTLRPAPKTVLKDAWLVEQGKLSSIERSTAEGDLFKIDLRIQGIPQKCST